ncbi:hypothetical protein CQA57_06965 [Helicobacter anseris]|uniref:Uncharacterized protein n=1 Tax=Helicobacter anseris TaxID=375926 RepID=A0A3D8J573_9HELI|nr:hypothetical protein CQA57_06965 [Helicobacter anseris]
MEVIDFMIDNDFINFLYNLLSMMVYTIFIIFMYIYFGKQLFVFKRKQMEANKIKCLILLIYVVLFCKAFYKAYLCFCYIFKIFNLNLWI